MKATTPVTTLLFITLMMNTYFVVAQNPSQLLNSKDFETRIREINTVSLVDIRRPDEFAKGHIRGALNIDWLGGEFETLIQTLDKTAPVMIYCLGGGRSASAAKRMQELGFQEIYELEGGLLKWRAAGLPEEITTTLLPELSRTQLDNILQSNPEVILVFYADWCGTCNKVKPMLLEIADQYEGNVNVHWINVDENRNLIKELGIDAIPTIQIYKQNSLIWTHQGYVEKERVIENF